jgi:hypothetical protein
MGKNIENRTILIISAIALIILAGYYIITTSPVEENYFTVEEVLRNKDRYIDIGTIIVRGYYDSNGPAIVSTPSDVTGKSTLDLDPYGVENASDILRDGVKFDFTGVLNEVNVGAPNSIVIFKAIKIEIV